MYKVKFILSNGNIKEVYSSSGLSLMEIAHQNHINEIDGACGGCVSCASCYIILKKRDYDRVIKSSPIKDDEKSILDVIFESRSISRLSCQIVMNDLLNGIEVRIPKKY